MGGAERGYDAATVPEGVPSEVHAPCIIGLGTKLRHRKIRVDNGRAKTDYSTVQSEAEIIERNTVFHLCECGHRPHSSQDVPCGRYGCECAEFTPQGAAFARWAAERAKTRAKTPSQQAENTHN